MRALIAALCCAALPAFGQSPFPVDIGGPFTLTDQHGQTRTEADPDGRAQLVFFGYANCLNICSAALPLMAEVVDVLAQDGINVTPVMITVAPDQDRVDTMGAPLAEIHRDFIGLTGDEDALQAAYDAFAVEITPLFQDPEYGWIYAHGSFVHLLDGDGELLTLLPPILDVDEAARIAHGYLAPRG
ncbi:SCO family protein [Tateyamaria armeniaca]|uniref:SCO family protein n=1 Tax=Tateyamaria armeniaca TaxID=2518930 RepID=A0ABW8US31_9RHOB